MDVGPMVRTRTWSASFRWEPTTKTIGGQKVHGIEQRNETETREERGKPPTASVCSTVCVFALELSRTHSTALSRHIHKRRDGVPSVCCVVVIIILHNIDSWDLICKTFVIQRICPLSCLHNVSVCVLCVCKLRNRHQKNDINHRDSINRLTSDLQR